jgi:uncharacterized protein
VRKMWAWLGLNLGKRAGAVSLVGLIVTLVLGFGITRLEFATGQDSYLNSSDQVAIDNEAYQDLFGGQAMITLYTMEGDRDLVDLFTPENVERMQTLEEELRAVDGVLGVVSPLTVLEFTQNMIIGPDGTAALDALDGTASAALERAREREEPGTPEWQAREDDFELTVNRLLGVEGEMNFQNPEWVEFLIYDNYGEIRKSQRPFFPDETHAQIIVRLEGNADIETEGAAAEAVHELTTAPGAQMDGAETLTIGAPLVLKELNDYLRGGILTLGAIAVAIMALILLLLFDVRWRLLPLGVILVGVIWAFGLAGFLGIPLSVVTIAGLPVMLGVGIDYAIQLHSRIEEEVIIDRASHPIQEAASRLGPALLMVMFNAIFAFVALRFAKVPMIRDFGLLLAVGITVICLCSILLPMTGLGAREFRSPTRGRDFSQGLLGRIVVGMGRMPAQVGGVLIFAALLIFAGGILVEDRLQLETDVEKWVNQDSQVIADVDSLRDETGSAGELGVFIQSDEIFSDETVAFVHDLAYREMEARPDDLLTASSMVTTVSFLLEVPGASNLPPTGQDVMEAHEVAPEDIRLSTVNPDAGALNLVFRTGGGSLEERAVYTNEIRDDLAADSTESLQATPSGLAVVGVGLLENLKDNRVLLTYLAIAFVFVFLTAILRSPLRGVLCLVPVLIAVGLASLGAWALGIKLSPMTAIGGPLVVAICTEFTTLILLRYLEERRRGMTPREASDMASARTGRAFVASALTGVAGVAVIATSSQPVLRDFGLVVTLNVTVALISALVILPPMLVWADVRGWVSKGMLKEQPDVVIPHDARPAFPAESPAVDPGQASAGGGGAPRAGAPPAPGARAAAPRFCGSVIPSRTTTMASGPNGKVARSRSPNWERTARLPTVRATTPR